MKDKKILFVCRQSPYGSTLARESLEAILAGGVFEQDIGVLFIDNGVFQLLPDQQAEAIEEKNHLAMLQALPLYDIENLYVEAESLHKRGLDQQSLPEHLQTEITMLDCAGAKKLLASSDSILSF